MQLLPFPNNPKNLEPSYKMDLDFWLVLEGKQLCLIAEKYSISISVNTFISRVVIQLLLYHVFH